MAAMVTVVVVVVVVMVVAVVTMAVMAVAVMAMKAVAVMAMATMVMAVVAMAMMVMAVAAVAVEIWMALAGWAGCRPQAVILVESGGAHGESGDGEVWIKLMSKLRCGKTDEGEGVGGVHPSGREGRTSGVKGRHGEAVGGGVGERDVVVGSDRGVLSGPALASNSPASLARLERPLGRGAVGGAGGLAFGRAAGAPAEADMEAHKSAWRGRRSWDRRRAGRSTHAARHRHMHRETRSHGTVHRRRRRRGFRSRSRRQLLPRDLAHPCAGAASHHVHGQDHNRLQRQR